MIIIGVRKGVYICVLKVITDALSGIRNGVVIGVFSGLLKRPLVVYVMMSLEVFLACP